MQKWKQWLIGILVLLIAIGVGYVFVVYYSYIFAKNVEGRVVGVKHGDKYGDKYADEYEGAYVVAIRTSNDEIFTTHSEDAQWALVRVGQCARAKYFPHPPWNFQESGTYFGAKLLSLRECTEDDGFWDPDRYCPGGSESMDTVPSSSRSDRSGGFNSLDSFDHSNDFDGSEKLKTEPFDERQDERRDKRRDERRDENKEGESSNFERVRKRYLEGLADS